MGKNARLYRSRQLTKIYSQYQHMISENIFDNTLTMTIAVYGMASSNSAKLGKFADNHRIQLCAIIHFVVFVKLRNFALDE